MSVWSRIVSRPHHPSLVEHGYKIVKTIGQGAYGRVYHVERLNDGKSYAAKIVGDVDLTPDGIPIEADILLHLTDVPNVPNIHDIFTTNNGSHVMVMDKPDEPFDTLQRTTDFDPHIVISNLIKILIDIDTLDICHMDIHSDNILVSKNNQVTLVDFGRARYKHTPFIHDPSCPLVSSYDELTHTSLQYIIREIEPNRQ